LREKTLVGISEASQILGVSEATLRQWTDEGSIKAFVTPGGHRRYSKEQLREFISSHEKMLGIKDLVIRLEDTADVHREIGAAFMNNTAWYGKMSKEHKKQLAALGRRILNLMVSYVSEPAKQEEIMRQAREIGADFGQTLASEGVPLTDSVQAFLSHRNPVNGIIADLMRKRELLGERVVSAVPLIEQLMDAALVSLVEAHPRYGALSPKVPLKKTAANRP